jgi:hypothetical protein
MSGASLEGLVKQQQPRLPEQRARHGKHLLLAARQLRAAIGTPLVQAREKRVGLVDAAAWPALASGEQVLLDGQAREDVARLRHEAQAPQRALVRAQAGA